MRSVELEARFPIRITLVRIRIQVFILMRILLLVSVMRICDQQWSIDPQGSFLSLQASFVGVLGFPLLFFDSNGEPDPYSACNANAAPDPDPVSKNNADPDPQSCLVSVKWCY
jgi:hypothetical protein